MNKLDTVLQLVSALRAIPDVARERRVVAYEVTKPKTVYVRADHCRVTVQRTLEPRVQIESDLRQAFGWEWLTEQDDAGIYVVLKRKPVVGALSTAALTLVVPVDAYLVFHLTPGSVRLEDFSGKLAVAPVQEGRAAVLPVPVDPAPER